VGSLTGYSRKDDIGLDVPCKLMTPNLGTEKKPRSLGSAGFGKEWGGMGVSLTSVTAGVSVFVLAFKSLEKIVG